eukprot:CAMPEP_0119015092 /NCGR_PEP_ID=MMETSP1176-20130426/10554_1 /TAXON_ID=265551 /ORGANISM="Synedropsis recta cf, Strain CCMP1620" /LENGTH=499 /DNA_ID=CAMNT_0006968359 /DNA_START=96 /DNA_END=1595 /DNA_ORIENTATION=-
MTSLIVAGASIEASDRVHDTSRGIKNQKWAVSCSIVSWLVAMVVVVMHISPVLSILFVNTKLEGGLCIIMMALWSALVAVISDSTNGLAVDGEGAVTFGNLYYGGWGGFICAVLLFLNYLKNVYLMRVDEELSLRSDRLALWAACLIVSIVLTAAAANVFDHECIGDSDRYGTKFCNRSLLALVDGAAGCGISIVIIGMKLSTGMAPWGIELLLAVFLFLCNCFSMGLVTAEDGPGAKIGNLFYFSWFNLIVPFMLMSAAFEYIRERHEEGKTKVVNAYEQQPMMMHQAPLPETNLRDNFVRVNTSNFGASSRSVAQTEYSGEGSQYQQSQYGDASVVSGNESRAGKPVYDRASFYSQGASSYVTDYQSEYGDGQSRADGVSYATGMDAGRSYASGMDDKSFLKPDKSGYYGGDMDTSFEKKAVGSSSTGMDGGYSQATGMDGGYSQASGMDASYQQPAKVKQQPWSGAADEDSYGSSFASGMDIKKPSKGGMGDSSFV